MERHWCTYLTLLYVGPNVTVVVCRTPLTSSHIPTHTHTPACVHACVRVYMHMRARYACKHARVCAHRYALQFCGGREALRARAVVVCRRGEQTSRGISTRVGASQPSVRGTNGDNNPRETHWSDDVPRLSKLFWVCSITKRRGDCRSRVDCRGGGDKGQGYETYLKYIYIFHTAVHCHRSHNKKKSAYNASRIVTLPVLLQCSRAPLQQQCCLR